jgi:hypothetical protein
MALTLLMETLDKALLDRAPKFRAELQAKGQRLVYLREVEQPVREAESTAVGRANARGSNLPYLQKVQAMNNAAQSAREIALAQAVESLPDERSSPSQD